MKADNRLRDIVDKITLHHMAQMSDIIVISDIAGKVIRANRRFYQETGFNEEFVRGGLIAAYSLYQGGKKEAAKVMRELLEHGMIEHHRTRLRGRDPNTRLDVELSLVLVGSPKKGDVYIIGVNKNVTALKELLTEIGKMKDDLWLRQTVHDPDNTTMILTDPQGRILYCNHTVIDMLGYELKEVINEAIEKFYFGGRRNARENFRKALRHDYRNSSFQKVQWIPSILRAKDGSPVSVEILFRIYRNDSNQEISSVLGVNRLSQSVTKYAFVSHATIDKPIVRKICAALEHIGIKTWIDEQEIPVSESIPGEIAAGISNSDFFIFCASPASLASEWCLEELHNALMQEKKGRPKVIPVRIQSCTLPAIISHRKYADIFANPTIGLLDLIAVLRPDMGETGIVRALKAVVEYKAG
jgi:PAS domain S-box-containing protein